MELIYPSAWRQTTGITQEEASDRAREMFNLYLNSGNDGECGDMACCEDQVILHRLDPTTGEPQVSNDGGITWTPDPAGIANQIVLYPPPVTEGGSTTKCDAATNASEHVNELITSTHDNLATAVTIFDLAVAIAGAALALFLIFVSAGTLTAPVTLLATTIWGAATAVFTLGVEAYDTYWTTDKKDIFLCKIYCNIGEDGQFTEEQYQAFRTSIKTTLPASPALDIIMTAINAGGARGLSQMASYGNAADADCASCHCDDTWCYDGDFTTTSFDWLFSSYQPASNPSVYNTSWTDGVGWQTTNGDPNYSFIKYQLSLVAGLRYAEFTSSGSDTVLSVKLPTATSESSAHNDANFISWTGAETDLYGGYGQRSRAIITAFHFEGVGTNPFGADNC